MVLGGVNMSDVEGKQITIEGVKDSTDNKANFIRITLNLSLIVNGFFGILFVAIGVVFSGTIIGDVLLFLGFIPLIVALLMFSAQRDLKDRNRGFVAKYQIGMVLTSLFYFTTIVAPILGVIGLSNSGKREVIDGMINPQGIPEERTQSCSECSFAVPVGKNFCTNCGAAISTLIEESMPQSLRESPNGKIAIGSVIVLIISTIVRNLWRIDYSLPQFPLLTLLGICLGFVVGIIAFVKHSKGNTSTGWVFVTIPVVIVVSFVLLLVLIAIAFSIL